MRRNSKISREANIGFEVNGLDFDYVEDELGLTVYGGGGKGGSSRPAPVQAPATPVQQAGIELIGAEEDDADEWDDEGRKKTRTGKNSLKIPLSVASDTGLKV